MRHVVSRAVSHKKLSAVNNVQHWPTASWAASWQRGDSHSLHLLVASTFWLISDLCIYKKTKKTASLSHSLSLVHTPFGRTAPSRDACPWVAEAATMKQRAEAIISVHCAIRVRRRARLCLCLARILARWALVKGSIHVCDCPHLCSVFVFICRIQLTAASPSQKPSSQASSPPIERPKWALTLALLVQIGTW